MNCIRFYGSTSTCHAEELVQGNISEDNDAEESGTLALRLLWKLWCICNIVIFIIYVILAMHISIYSSLLVDWSEQIYNKVTT